MNSILGCMGGLAVVVSSREVVGSNPGTVYFCLRPSAKDQGITLVILVLVVLVLHLLVHFLFKRHLSEKKSP